MLFLAENTCIGSFVCPPRSLCKQWMTLSNANDWLTAHPLTSNEFVFGAGIMSQGHLTSPKTDVPVLPPEMLLTAFVTYFKESELYKNKQHQQRSSCFFFNLCICQRENATSQKPMCRFVTRTMSIYPKRICQTHVYYRIGKINKRYNDENNWNRTQSLQKFLSNQKNERFRF